MQAIVSVFEAAETTENIPLDLFADLFDVSRTTIERWRTQGDDFREPVGQPYQFHCLLYLWCEILGLDHHRIPWYLSVIPDRHIQERYAERHSGAIKLAKQNTINKTPDARRVFLANLENG